MEKSQSRTRIISTLVLAALMGISIWFGSALASSEDYHQKDITYLEEKQNNAKALSASASTVSVLISLLPEDAATPLANQISNVGRDFMIILSALSTERYLLTITGRVMFCWIIPIGLGIMILFVLLRRKLFLQIGLKLAIAGCVLYMLVPVTLRITRLIDSSYEDVVDNSLQQSKMIQDALHFNENGIIFPGMGGNPTISATEAEKISEAQAGIQAEAQAQVDKANEVVQASSSVTDVQAQAQNANEAVQASSSVTEAQTQVQKAKAADQAFSDGTEAQTQKEKSEKELPWYEELWNGFSDMVSGAVDTASQFIGKVADTVSDAVNTVSDVVNTVSDMASTAVDEVIDAGGKALEVVEMVPQVPQMAADLLNNLIDAFVLMIVTTCVLPIAVLIGLLFIMSQILGAHYDWDKQES